MDDTRPAEALNDYLKDVKLENCRVNDGYLSALGLTRTMADVGSSQQAEPQEQQPLLPGTRDGTATGTPVVIGSRA